MSNASGGIPLPALTPNNDTRLNLDDLIDASPAPDAPVPHAPAGGARRGPGAGIRRRRGRTPRNRDGVMPLIDHIIELRRRIVWSALGIAVMSVVGWMFSDAVFRILQQPFLDAAGQQDGLMSITFTGVVSAFNMRLQIAFFLGLVMSCPWWAYQLWAFINPGLKRKERWTAIAFIAVSVPLFLTGAAIAWMFLPQAIAILTGFAPEHTATLLSADVYFTFIMRMTLAFGLSFLLPVVMVALTMMGAVTSRTWLNQWRLAVLIAFIFAAVATPTGDAGTLCALALPICAIYFAAILICWGYERIQLRAIMRAAGEQTRLHRWLHAMRKRAAGIARVGRAARGNNQGSNPSTDQTTGKEA